MYVFTNKQRSTDFIRVNLTEEFMEGNLLMVK
jgi:hypothetical protein